MEMNDEEEELGFSRNYFLAKELGSSNKKQTLKLSDIDLVDEQELRAAAANIEPKHESDIIALLNSYKKLYPRWVFELRCGFGLLMYGFGSKKALIEDFASTALTEYAVVVINGYLQSINLKQVIIALAELWWNQLKTKRKGSSSILPKVQQPFSSRSMDDLLAFLDGSQVEEMILLYVLSFITLMGLDYETLKANSILHNLLLVRISLSSPLLTMSMHPYVSEPFSFCYIRLPCMNLWTLPRLELIDWSKYSKVACASFQVTHKTKACHINLSLILVQFLDLNPK